MSGLFPTRYAPAPAKARLAKPKVQPDRSPDGRLCTAACMFALGPECDCFCLGRNHQQGRIVLVCDDPQQSLL